MLQFVLYDDLIRILLFFVAWAKSQRPEAVSRAEALIKKMEESTSVSPDLLSYSGLISCVSKSKRK